MIRVQRSGRGFLSGDASSTINDMLNACSLGVAKSLLITDAFLFKCLVKGDAPYSVSSFFAKSIFEKNNQISAVAFPCVQQDGAINFAIKTKDFWKVWGVIGARKMHVRHLRCGFYEISLTEHVVGLLLKVSWCGAEGALRMMSLSVLYLYGIPRLTWKLMLFACRIEMANV